MKSELTHFLAIARDDGMKTKNSARRNEDAYRTVLDELGSAYLTRLISDQLGGPNSRSSIDDQNFSVRSNRGPGSCSG